MSKELRRYSLPLTILDQNNIACSVGSMEEELECLVKFLDEMIDLHAYGVELLVRLQKKYSSVNKLKEKIKDMIDDI